MRKIITYSIIILVALTIGIIAFANKPEPSFGGSPEITDIEINGKNHKVEYTDDNTDETLIIRTEKSSYGGWNQIEFIFSVENTTANSDDVEIRFYLSGEEIMADVSELKKNVAYEVKVNDYGTVETVCTTLELVNGEMGDYYLCDDVSMGCNSVEGTTCIKDNVKIGDHLETRYKDNWDKKDKKNEDKKKDKKISKKSVDYKIKANSITYFKGIITVPPKSKGNFYIEVDGLNTYGILK